MTATEVAERHEEKLIALARCWSACTTSCLPRW